MSESKAKRGRPPLPEEEKFECQFKLRLRQSVDGDMISLIESANSKAGLIKLALSNLLDQPVSEELARLLTTE